MPSASSLRARASGRASGQGAGGGAQDSANPDDEKRLTDEGEGEGAEGAEGAEGEAAPETKKKGLFSWCAPDPDAPPDPEAEDGKKCCGGSGYLTVNEPEYTDIDVEFTPLIKRLALEKRKVKLKSEAIIFIVFFAVFLYVLNTDAEINNAFYIERSLRDDFLQRTFEVPSLGSPMPSTTTGNITTTVVPEKATKTFAKINDAAEYWSWLNTVFMAEVRVVSPFSSVV